MKTKTEHISGGRASQRQIKKESPNPKPFNPPKFITTYLEALPKSLIIIERVPKPKLSFRFLTVVGSVIFFHRRKPVLRQVQLQIEG